MKSLSWVGVFCLVLAGEAAAGKVQKVDLTDYLDGHPVVGDFRIYDRDDGETLEIDTTQVTELRKSTRYMVQINEAGDIQTGIDEIVHGKEFRVGSEFAGDLALVTAKPKKIESFLFAPGVPQKAKIGLTVFFQGSKVGKATLAASTTFVGFESVVPEGTTATPQIAHMHREETLTIKGGGTVIVQNSVSDSWIDPVLGTLRMQRSVESFQDGSPSSTFGPFVYTFDHGQHDGVPVVP